MGVAWVVACEAGILKGREREFGLKITWKGEVSEEGLRTFRPSHEPGIPGICYGSVWYNL